jgi:hypothetical protein
MQIVVQEGRALISLISPIHAPDENLRTTTVESLAGLVKVYYRDHEVIRVVARDDALEVLPSTLGAITWVEKTRRYQLKVEG